jgi:hypothetical protein
MMKLMKHHSALSKRFVVPLAGLLLAAVGDVYAFTSLKKEFISAMAVIGGDVAPQKPLKILHTPLQAISSITKLAIVQGSVGANPSTLGAASFTSRATPDVQATATTNKIRVTVEFRTVDSSTPGSIESAPITRLPSVDGPDPMAFAFQITPSSITTGVLQYQIYADRIDSNGVVIPLTRKYFFTSSASTNPWTTVGVQAEGAAQVFSVEGGRFVLPDGNPNDAETMMNIPSGVIRTPTTVSLNEIPLDSSLVPQADQLASPVSIYRWDSTPPFSGLVRLSLLYPDFVFPTGQQGLLGATGIPEKNGIVMGWDGFSWRKLGGQGDFSANTISLQSGYYNYLAIVAGASAVSALDRRPAEKILTPNNDTINDHVDFDFSGLTGKVEIFDISNHRVRTLSGTNTMLRWDGTDDSGRIVESGVYIYQYKADDTLISGVIGVAK